MSTRVLITGGAGFIGSHLADELLMQGYEVRALDCLVPQVHGESRQRPDYLDPAVELIVGDVRNAADIRRALEGVDAVFHFAAAVGVGQSMYQIEHYTSTNALGTAVLLEALADQPAKKLVVASSMSIYGEGSYRDSSGRLVEANERTVDQLRLQQWDLLDPGGVPLQPVPTGETKTPAASSVYALGKYDQERLSLIVGGAYGIPTVALRFFNVYGPRQALSNPYTGVLAIFGSRCLNGEPPLVFEDGQQQRDFVHVTDVARACRLAMESPVAGEVFNIGSGQPVTIESIAERVLAVTGNGNLQPDITGKFRVGDIRHCFADIEKAHRELGYQPQVDFDDGLAEFAEWLSGQVVVSRSEDATRELRQKGLLP